MRACLSDRVYFVFVRIPYLCDTSSARAGLPEIIGPNRTAEMMHARIPTFLNPFRAAEERNSLDPAHHPVKFLYGDGRESCERNSHKLV